MARNPLSPFRSGGLAGAGFAGDPFLSLHREMNRLFDDAFRGVSGQPSQGQGTEGSMLMPHMDVSENERGLTICAELPGVSENEIDIRLEDDVLVIRGEKKFERKDEKENYHFMERSYGTFQRAIRLPGPVDPDQVKASFENGVLTVFLPKNEQQQRSRRIQVQGGSRAQGQGGKQIEGEAGQSKGGRQTEGDLGKAKGGGQR
jgi:HSP20 family protein